MTLHCAVLEDYQGGRARDGRLDELIEARADVDIIVVMGERTPPPASVFARLPRLELVPDLRKR